MILCPSMLPLSYDVILDRALAEDLSSGDVTTEACILHTAQAVAHAVARGPIVVCGGQVFARVFAKIDGAVGFLAHHEDGAHVERGTKVWTLRGPARSILMGERTALNLAQRMCGIATTTRTYVDAVAPAMAVSFR